MAGAFEEMDVSDVSKFFVSDKIERKQGNEGEEKTIPLQSGSSGESGRNDGYNWQGRGDREKSKENVGATEIDLPATFKLEPTVGWLVCVSGVDKGRSFRLVKGNNPIGRPGNGKNYAVELTDQQISRKGAAGVIVYNEKDNKFYIMPGDLTTNINPYLNDEILLSPRLLTPRSVLEVADDVLIFVPFCCDKFVWRYKTEEKSQRTESGYQISRENVQPEQQSDTIPPRKNDPDGPTAVFFPK